MNDLLFDAVGLHAKLVAYTHINISNFVNLRVSFIPSVKLVLFTLRVLSNLTGMAPFRFSIWSCSPSICYIVLHLASLP